MSLQQHDIESILRKTILAEIIMSSQAANMPEKFVENIKLVKKSDTEYVIENSWEKDGKPLAVFFEHGTKDHWVEPKDGGVLAFVQKKSSGSKAIYGGAAPPDGTVFSKGHYVSGLPALEPMNRGFKIGQQKFAEMMKNG